MPRIYTDKGPVAQLLQLYRARETGVRESDLIDRQAVEHFQSIWWCHRFNDGTRIIGGAGVNAVEALGLAEARETTDEWLERLDEEARKGARPYPDFSEAWDEAGRAASRAESSYPTLYRVVTALVDNLRPIERRQLLRFITDRKLEEF